MGLQEVNREEIKDKEKLLETFLWAWERLNSRDLLWSCGGEHGSDPESGGESGNWLCLGMKRKFSSLLGGSMEDDHKATLKAARGAPSGY